MNVCRTWEHRDISPGPAATPCDQRLCLCGATPALPSTELGGPANPGGQDGCRGALSLLSSPPHLCQVWVAPAAGLGANPDPVLPENPFREAGFSPAAPPSWGRHRPVSWRTPGRGRTPSVAVVPRAQQEPAAQRPHPGRTAAAREQVAWRGAVLATACLRRKSSRTAFPRFLRDWCGPSLLWSLVSEAPRSACSRSLPPAGKSDADHSPGNEPRGRDESAAGPGQQSCVRKRSETNGQGSQT